MKKLKDISVEDLLSILIVCTGLISVVVYPDKIEDIVWYTVGGVALIRIFW